ncbi:TonB system transport protein ExbD [Pseudogemmobacter blasticus]|uniref:Biopolymer transport protein ExbD n=1 Tax=Fuscovulum blasticum DSM 2131 TaxID=1188250 RepID=A0A2T4JF47_FUSBL|nr:TonB system transport protein ExbD [Fuscovulum blasticum]PTE16545.1 TonB system transport protein ExbD [Fuscovulum blasticum DSM 2131]
MALRLDEGDTELSEINVTPFIDVILVLLIVFMVAAPLSTVDVQVNLPASSAPPADRPADPLWLTFTESRALLLDETEIDRNALAAVLDARTGGQRDTPVFLRADRSIDYGALMGVLDSLRRAGYLKVALVGLEGAP